MTLARCPMKACCVRWRFGPDRDCGTHEVDIGSEAIAAAMAAPNGTQRRAQPVHTAPVRAPRDR